MRLEIAIVWKFLLDLKQSKYKYSNLKLEKFESNYQSWFKIYNKEALILNFHSTSSWNQIIINRVWCSYSKTDEELKFTEELENEIKEFIKEKKLESNDLFKTRIPSKNFKHILACDTNYFNNISEKKLKLLKSKLDNLTEEDIEFIYKEIISSMFKGKEVFINHYKKEWVVEIKVSKTTIYLI